MNSEFKKGIHLFYKEIEKVVKDEDEQNYLKLKFLKFIEDNILRFESEMERKEEKLKELEEKSYLVENVMAEFRNKLNFLENEIYGDEEGEEFFEIVCPYCNFEFDADIGDEIEEIRCPECDNIIELDWGDNDENQDDNNGCCGGGCSHCGNCE